MKRELKVGGVKYQRVKITVEEPFPMKRELKGYYSMLPQALQLQLKSPSR